MINFYRKTSKNIRYFIVLTLILLTSSCVFPGSTKPVIKIGLIAPFEGEQRANGYQRLFGVKLALQEMNLSGGVADYKIALIALNDYADEDETILQAQELVLDPDIRGIIGQWNPHLFYITLPIYEEANLAVVDPSQISDFSGLDATFDADIQTLGANLADTQAKQAYVATYILTKAIEQAILKTGKPERAAVLEALNTLDKANNLK